MHLTEGAIGITKETAEHTYLHAHDLGRVLHRGTLLLQPVNGRLGL